MKMPFPENKKFTPAPAVRIRVDKNKYIAIDSLPDETAAQKAGEQPPALKRQIFEGIKKKRPAFLALMNDELVIAMKKNFGAKIMLSELEIKELISKE